MHLDIKIVHAWCSVPKERQHKGTEKANMRKEEFLKFLMQDTITFSNPSKKYVGKSFLLHLLEETYNRYILQPRYHKKRKVSKTTMHTYHPKHVLLAGTTPLNQCLCDYCENTELVIKPLTAAGVVGMPANKYVAVTESLCNVRQVQFGTHYRFAPHDCIMRSCEMCGKEKMKKILEDQNKELLTSHEKQNKWHKWKTVPEKCDEWSRNTILVTSTQVHYLSHCTVQYGAHLLISAFAVRTPARADQPVE